MSFWITPRKPMNSAVIEPMIITKDSAVSDNSNNGDMRATMKIPAVTMVAAWISAEIGVGPSIESGSQTCRGTCADLPIAPMNNRMQVALINETVPQLQPAKSVIVASAIDGACSKTVL